jgi:hypothetical protein
MISTISLMWLVLINVCMIWIGNKGICSWRWKSIQQLSGITGCISLGILSFKDTRIQQGRMLGSTKGGFTT